jgi:broad specificity phosphatase PhoE
VNGRTQARSLAEQLQGHPFLAVYASSLLRAKETADLIAAAVHLPVTPEPRLAEINQGEWEGQLVDVIKTRYNELWQQRIIDPASVRPPGGETVAEVAGRVYAALNDIAHLHPIGLVLVVSHGLALAAAICKVRGLPIGQAYMVIPDNAKPVWIDWEQ